MGADNKIDYELLLDSVKNSPFLTNIAELLQAFGNHLPKERRNLSMHNIKGELDGTNHMLPSLDPQALLDTEANISGLHNLIEDMICTARDTQGDESKSYMPRYKELITKIKKKPLMTEL